MRFIGIIIAFVSAAGWAAVPAPYPITVDSRAANAPGVEVFRAGQASFRATYVDGGVTQSISGLTPFMVWSTSNTATTYATSTYTVVSAASGMVDFVFSPSNINYSPGRYVYQIGLTQTNNNVSVYREGVFLIRGSPFASGGSSVAWSTNLNWATISWSGLPTTLDGYGIANAVTNTDPAFTAALTNLSVTVPLEVSGTGRTRALSFNTNSVPVRGTLNGTNGIYWVDGTTTNWILFGTP